MDMHQTEITNEKISSFFPLDAVLYSFVLFFFVLTEDHLD